MTASPDVDDALFWDLAEPLMASGTAEEGELMRSRCLRVNGDFLAMPEYRTGDLVVKLPAERVSALIADGTGLAFAPAKKVFKEWVQVPGRDEALWKTLLDEGLEFAS
ncbi:MAG: hypothetical protein ACR2P0_15945 [Acidimicrobiales bacterium]